MPLFAYLCKDCEEPSEILVRGSEKPVCPHCGSKRIEKQMSHFAPMIGQTSSPPPSCASCCAGGGCPMRD